MLTSTERLANAEVIYQFFISNHFGQFGACAVVESAKAESALDPNAISNDSTSAGLLQWLLARREAIFRGTGIKMLDPRNMPSVLDQCRAAQWELLGTEHFARQQTLEQFSAYQAGYAFCRWYERPADPAQWDIRGRGAEEWYDYFVNHGKVPAL